jgi:hypothetical protein
MTQMNAANIDQPAQMNAQPSIIYVVPGNFGPVPVQTLCPNCKADIMSRIDYESGVATWLLVGALCFVG